MEMQDKVVNTPFRGVKITLHPAKYQNGNNALEFIETETGYPYLRASVNPSIDIPADLIAIKDYSENHGVGDYLRAIGIISNVRAHVQSGYIKIPVYALTKEGCALFSA